MYKSSDATNFSSAQPTDLPSAPLRPQAELLLRCEELRDELWDLCDAKMEANEAEKQRITADSFTPDQLAATSQQLLALVQLELDRFAGTAAFVRAVATFRAGILEMSDQPALPAAPSVFAAPPADMRDMLDGKAALPMPDWVSSLQAKSANLCTAFKLAVILLTQTEKALESGGADPKKAAAAKPPPGGKPGASSAEIDPAKLELVRAEVARCVALEADITKRRLQQLAASAASYLDDLTEAQAHVDGLVTEWVKASYTAECSAVSALEAIVKKAAHDKTPLPYDLRLEVRGDRGLAIARFSAAASLYVVQCHCLIAYVLCIYPCSTVTGR